MIQESFSTPKEAEDSSSVSLVIISVAGGVEHEVDRGAMGSE